MIDRHIEILLLDNDCVIVPGLGGFMAHPVSARYCAESQTYLPPLRQLGFNAQLQINDSLLAQSYIEAYDISYPEAIRRIEDEVNELQQILSNEGSCELNDIGVLRLNDEGHIEFEPCDAGILTPELYGLNSVDILPLDFKNETSAEKPAEKLAEKKNDNIISVMPRTTATPALAVAPEAEAETTDADTDTEKRFTIRISTLKHIAAAACLALLFVIALPFGQSTHPNLTKSYLDTGILYNILPQQMKDSPARRDIHFCNIKKEVIEEAVAEAPLPAEETQPADTHQPFYSIVLASRVTKVNAEAFVEKLKKAGFDKAEIIERSNGAKVIYGRFGSEDEARSFLRNLRSSAESFADGWIMEFDR